MLMSQFVLCYLFSSCLFSSLLSLPDRFSLLHSETFIGFDCRLDSTGTDSFSGDSRKTRATRTDSFSGDSRKTRTTRTDSFSGDSRKTITTFHRNFPSRLCHPSCPRSVHSQRRSPSPASRLAVLSIDSSSVSGVIAAPVSKSNHLVALLRSTFQLMTSGKYFNRRVSPLRLYTTDPL